MAHDILIVDDERDIRELVAGILQDEGYRPRQAANSDQAIDEIQNRVPSLVILDIWLEGSRLDGLELLNKIMAEYPEMPVLIMSGHGTIETAVSAIKLGAYDFVEKPFQSDRLLVIVDRAIESARLRREVAELRVRAGQENLLIGDSGAIASVRQTIEKVAPTGSRILISGPAGSGKEVVARLLHAKSRRANGPFVVLNAANLAPERMEQELFGVEEGASGQGSLRQIGTFERAHGGTLFLDEVADMPPETQAKILRVLVEQAFTRVGGNKRVQVDVRVVSGSSQDLRELIREGHFREDLYHRLNVVPIEVPPLTNRLEDIPILARHFIKRTAEASGLQPKELSEDAVAAMQTYTWPGNVRELRNLIERLLILSQGDKAAIASDMLPGEFRESVPAALRQEKSEHILALPLRDAREVFEREYLTSQIARFGGNVSRTASFVGMERSALHRKLKLLGVSSNDKS